MGLKTQIDAARTQADANEQRLACLHALRAEGLEFDPAGIDFITFWVDEFGNNRSVARPVRAARLTTGGGWTWNGRQGPWSELIDYVTTEVCPLAVTRPAETKTTSLLQ